MGRQGLAGLLKTLDADPRHRGRQFEEICRWYLLNDPVYRAQVSSRTFDSSIVRTFMTSV